MIGTPAQSAHTTEPRFEGDFALPANFALDAGGTLENAALRYAWYGQPPAAENTVLVCHALSGSARVGDWWPALFAPGGLLDPDEVCILGVNVLGSCYGSTGPTSIDPRTGQPYGDTFPLVSIGDMVRAQSHLIEALGIRSLRLAIGASLGGMQVMEWCIRFPDRVRRAIAIGATPLNAFGLALNHLQRTAIRLDPHWRDGQSGTDAPLQAGLSLAREIAVCSYKSHALFDERFARKPNRNGEDSFSDTGLAAEPRFDVAGYLDYQGSRFSRRFSAASYIALTRAMDIFDISETSERPLALRPANSDPSGNSHPHAPARDSALTAIQAEITLVGISSDLLFPTRDVRALAAKFSATGVRCDYRELVSSHGHDAFLAEPEHLTALLR